MSFCEKFVARGPRGGGRLHYEMPGCVCWGSEHVPIMKDALGKNKTYPY